MTTLGAGRGGRCGGEDIDVSIQRNLFCMMRFTNLLCPLLQNESSCGSSFFIPSNLILIFINKGNWMYESFVHQLNRLFRNLFHMRWLKIYLFLLLLHKPSLGPSPFYPLLSNSVLIILINTGSWMDLSSFLIFKQYFILHDVVKKICYVRYFSTNRL